MERPQYKKTFEVGQDREGRKVFLTVELRHRANLIVRETVAHKKVTEWTELSISGVVQGRSAGQIRDVLDTLSAYTIPEETIREIAEIWDRWHLNGMKAGCVHQPEEWICYGFPGVHKETVNGWHLKPVYPKRGDACTFCGRDRWDTDACPKGYRYGNAWLVDPLPPEIAEKVKTWGAGQETRDAYAEQAQNFLSRFGLEVRAAYKGEKPPKWAGEGGHGDHYRVTVRRISETDARTAGLHSFSGGPARSISFDFWGSVAMKQEGERPSAYTILACISSDAYMPTDPDEVVAELGEMPPSQAIAAARFAVKLQAFFTAEELEALGEIR